MKAVILAAALAPGLIGVNAQGLSPEDIAAFKAIPHRDVEIVVFMTDTGEQKCKIRVDERKALK